MEWKSTPVKCTVSLLIMAAALCLGGCGRDSSAFAENGGQPSEMSAYAAVEIPTPAPSAKSAQPSATVQENAAKKATVAAVGDVMVMSAQIAAAKTEDGYDFDSVFRLVSPYITQADVAVANLETPVAGEEMGYSVSGTAQPDGTKSLSFFNAPVELLDTLGRAGFDILGTANNHVLDKGRQGLEETVQNIRNAGMACVGTQLPGEERNIAITHANGITFAVLAYTSGVNGNWGAYSGGDVSQAVNLIDSDGICSDIKRAREMGADVVTLCLHAGEEKVAAPESYMTEWAKTFIAAGADVLFYSHPHILRKAEWLTAGEGEDGRQGVVFYSLGNFLSNMDGDECLRGAVAFVDVEKDEAGVRLTGARYLPTYCWRSGDEYVLLPCAPGSIESVQKELGEGAAGTAKGAYDRTVALMGTDAATPEE